MLWVKKDLAAVEVETGQLHRPPFKDSIHIPVIAVCFTEVLDVRFRLFG